MSERKHPTIKSVRLVDEFLAVADRLGLHIAGEISECGMFVDLQWKPHGFCLEDISARTARDPAFTVTGWTRWLAFARICNHIRYYAAPLPIGAASWHESDAERRAAIEAEPNESELGILPSVANAVALTLEYLAGVPFALIKASRIK